MGSRTPAAAVLPDGYDVDGLIGRLRQAGARFVYLHGSRVGGTPRPGADVDIAAWFGRPVAAWEVELPAGADLLVLDDAPDELAGRVAQHGLLLFEDDPPARVRWQAQASKRYLDEAPRRQSTRATVLGSG